MSSLLLLVPAVLGCSDGGSNKPDAFVIVADAKPDAPPLPPGCDAQELRDDTNDDFSVQTGSPEDTGLMFAGTPLVICGTANTNHFLPPMAPATLGVVDIDSYKFTLTADAAIYVTLSGAGLENLKGNFRIYGGADFDEPELFGEMHVGHTANRVSLAAGTYELAALVLNTAATTADVKYKIKVIAEAVDSRCVSLTTGGYAEVETGANTANDMILWDYDAVDPAPNISLTTSATDAPENTLITAAPGMTYRLSGNSANNALAPAGEDYKDHDTFKFTTGPLTNEITIRSKFATTTADLDVLIASEPAVGATEPNILDISNRLAAGPSEEVLTTAVEPNTTYWLWVGGYKDHPPGMAPSTASPYEATICSSTFVVP